jgi:hypothetical protein
MAGGASTKNSIEIKNFDTNIIIPILALQKKCLTQIIQF